VLVCDDLAAEGVEILRRAPGFAVDVRVGLKPQELLEIAPRYEGLAVRSATRVNAEVIAAATRLRVVGRAGSGTDNIDLAAATRRGVVVMNAPGGNTITVAEHTFALLLALARRVSHAHAALRDGRWEKKRFQGKELFNKTLGVVGLGNIGSVVAQRAAGFRMKVIGYDPVLTAEAAAKMGVELMALDELLRRADAVTLHVPLTESTRNLIDARALALMKPGALLVNCARGGLVDEKALHGALAEGRIGGAACDVFEEEPPATDNPLLKLDNFIGTPHLGGSTDEAQVNVAVAIAEQMVDYLVHGTVANAVNVPSVTREVLETLGPFLVLGEKLGSLAAQLAPAPVTEVAVEFAGEVQTKTVAPVTRAILKGVLKHFLDEPVNEVSAPALARERGLRVSERTVSDHSDFTSLIAVRLGGPSGSLEVAGTIFGRRDPRIVRVGGFELEAVPEGHILAVHNEDKRGVIGNLGTTLADAGVNIARMQLARDPRRAEAFALVSVDSPAAPEVLARLRALPHVLSVTQVQLA
jgi:D-3-phosphoglycerate dehydrogenase/(S)-sulfolactate dehydrogenase